MSRKTHPDNDFPKFSPGLAALGHRSPPPSVPPRTAAAAAGPREDYLGCHHPAAWPGPVDGSIGWVKKRGRNKPRKDV